MAFQKGQSGNPGGRPKGQAKYLDSLYRLVKTKDWRAIVERAIQQAKNGDKTARQWLSDYILGKPIQTTQLTGMDGDVIRVTLLDDRSPDQS
jgi:hypothetical protein